MRKMFLITAAAVCVTVPAFAGTAITEVTQVTTYGNNSARIVQFGRDGAGTALTQATVYGDNVGAIRQRGIDTAVKAGQGTAFGSNSLSVFQSNFLRNR